MFIGELTVSRQTPINADDRRLWDRRVTIYVLVLSVAGLDSVETEDGDLLKQISCWSLISSIINGLTVIPQKTHVQCRCFRVCGFDYQT